MQHPLSLSVAGRHPGDLSPSISGNAPQQGAAALHAAGLPPSDAKAGTMALLHGRLVTQAIVNAFADTFRYQAALGVLASLLLVGLGRSKQVNKAWRSFHQLVQCDIELWSLRDR